MKGGVAKPFFSVVLRPRIAMEEAGSRENVHLAGRPREEAANCSRGRNRPVVPKRQGHSALLYFSRNRMPRLKSALTAGRTLEPGVYCNRRLISPTRNWDRSGKRGGKGRVGRARSFLGFSRFIRREGITPSNKQCRKIETYPWCVSMKPRDKYWITFPFVFLCTFATFFAVSILFEIELALIERRPSMRPCIL